LAVNFTRISVFAVYFSALLSIFSGYLRLYDNFVIPALVGFPFNLILITSFFVSTKTSIYVIAIGSVLATAAQLLLLIPFIRRTGFRYQPIFDFSNKYIKMMLMIAFPVMMSQSVSRINVLVDRTLASAIAVGGISALNYATRLDGFVQGFFVDSMTTVLYPMISKMAVEGNVKGLKAYVAEAISIINLLVVPATIGAMLFSQEIVTLLFGRGAFTPEAIDMTATALFFYSIGMIAKGLRSILSRAFYAFQDTKTPMINATIGVTLNIILNLILSRYLGIGGLALATSIAAIVTALLMFISLRKKIGGFGLKEISRSFIKISIASVLMGFIAYGTFFFSGKHLSQNISLLLAIGVGALVYAVMVYFLKIPEADSALKAVKRKIGMRFNSSKGF
ncbi:MAG: murein biosynthesis integral membrane protein MurJ, partial [Firmicutes bacterium]|nr:murein biosynthesis integral membrane protein MurJ [Bacillota bacterium]